MLAWLLPKAGAAQEKWWEGCGARRRAVLDHASSIMLVSKVLRQLNDQRDRVSGNTQVGGRSLG